LFVDIVHDFVPPAGSFILNELPDDISPSSPSSSPPSLVSSDSSSVEMSDYLTQSEGAGEAATSTAGSVIYGETALDSEPMFTSPPTVPVYIEPEVPDPFLIDDDEDDSDEDTGITPTDSQHPTPAADEVPLATPNPFGSPLQSPNRNKDVPPPPQSDSDEEDSPELYLPGLCIPTMFLPIPNVRAFSPPLIVWWLRCSMYRRRIL
jgi:hypothetical protein